MLSEQMVLIDALDEAIERVSQEIAHRLDPPPDPTKAEAGLQNETNQKTETAAPETSAEMLGSLQEEQPLSWKEAVVLLESIPGINQRAAEGILAEIGIEMARFPTAGHLASWSRRENYTAMVTPSDRSWRRKQKRQATKSK